MPNWLPYCGEAPGRDDWFARWNLAPELLLALVVFAAAIWLWRDRLRVQQATGALAVLVFLYVSPFCALGSALFTVRIVHDILLAALLAPLAVAALRLDNLHIGGSRSVWTAIHALTFWFWHALPL